MTPRCSDVTGIRSRKRYPNSPFDDGVRSPLEIGAAYLLITALCVGFSAFSTFVGMREYAKELMVVSIIAVTVSAGLLTCDLSIPGRRRQGSGIIGVVIVFLMCTALSWSFNFHFFYKLAVAGDLAKARLELSSNRFDDNLSRAMTALSSLQHLGKLRTEIDYFFDRLREQIENKLRGRFGAEANKEADAIEALVAMIPARITKLPRPSTSSPERTVNDYVANLKRIVYYELERAEIADPWKATIGNLQRLREKKANLLKEATARQQDDAAYLIARTRDLSDLSKEAESLTTQAFARHKRGTEPPVFEPIDANGIDMNSMSVSLQIALSTINNQPTDLPMFAKTLAAGTLALFVDMLPLIMALVLIPRKGT